MADAKGIKETQELLSGVEELALFIIKQKKAGRFSAMGLPAIIADGLAQGIGAKIQGAVDGIGDVDDELKDLSLEEMEALVEQAGKMPFKIIKALKQ